MTFWQQHAITLQRAQRQFGVPASVIVAIIGIESSYGKNKGKFRVIDALSTLAFNYPRREKFFTKELTEFLLLTREQKLAPLKVYGSYAGAIGQPQFMPSSYRQYAIDFANNGKINLSDDTIDVIGSIAKYLHTHGWKSQQPVAVPSKLANDKYLALIKENPQPTMTIQQFARYGITPLKHINKTAQATLVNFAINFTPSYWLLLHNFRVIKRYNPSNSYAMAVLQLSQAINNTRDKWQA